MTGADSHFTRGLSTGSFRLRTLCGSFTCPARAAGRARSALLDGDCRGALAEFNEKMLCYLPMGGLLGFLFLTEIFLIADNDLIPWAAAALLRAIPRCNATEGQAQVACITGRVGV